jgi:hypothetical protein
VTQFEVVCQHGNALHRTVNVSTALRITLDGTKGAESVDMPESGKGVA